MENIKIIKATEDNLSKYSICGYNNIKNKGYKKKVDWIKNEFKSGLVYKFLVNEEDKAIGGIEYIPGEFAHKPVIANGYMFINCIYIIKKEYKQKGYGNLLLNECIREAKENNMNGVVSIARKGSWMPGKELFIKNGFEIVDQKKPDFILVTKKFNKDFENPIFRDNSENLSTKYKQGVFIFKSEQCPYLEKCVPEMIEILESKYDIDPVLIDISEAKEAQKSPSPFGVFCIVINGKVVTENPISKTRFENILKKELLDNF